MKQLPVLVQTIFEMGKTFLSTLILCIILFSCNKDDTDSKPEELTNGSWKLTEFQTDYDKDGVYEENTYANLADCVKDNIFTFLSNGDVTQDEGPRKCDDTSPQSSTSTWSFQDNGASLQWGGVKSTIEELSATTLKLKHRTSYNVIFTIDVRRTYSKL
jgi:hypothetical protein